MMLCTHIVNFASPSHIILRNNHCNYHNIPPHNNLYPSDPKNSLIYLQVNFDLILNLYFLKTWYGVSRILDDPGKYN